MRLDFIFALFNPAATFLSQGEASRAEAPYSSFLCELY